MIPKKTQPRVDSRMNSPRASLAFSALETVVRSVCTFLRSLLHALESKLETTKGRERRPRGNLRSPCGVLPAVPDVGSVNFHSANFPVDEGR
jgi:hypothetical protein